MGRWKTSITELLLNYRGALQSIIPWLEKSCIPFKEGDSYDDWDTISSTLYEIIVINSILYSESINEERSFAKYDFEYHNYNDLNFIFCDNPFNKDEFVVFVSFCIKDNFEKINVCNIDKNSLKVNSRNKIKFSETNFFINKKNPTETIVVEL